ncbi:MAG: hypothetical protein AAFV95_20110 [Bacteroidota bacterium]
MRLFILLSFLFAMSCGESNSTAPTDSQTQAKTVAEPSSGDVPEKKDACEFFTNEQMAALMDWPVEVVSNEQLMSLEDRGITVCGYYDTERSESILLRLKWPSEKARENKILERSFKRYLEQGEEELRYQPAKTSTGTEAIFGHGPSHHGFTHYLLRCRYGNEIDVVIESMSKTNDPSAFETRLQKILNAL